MMARGVRRVGVVDEPDDVREADSAAVRDERDAPPSVLSGWCMSGYHRASEQTVGCKHTFATFVCPCPCHDPSRAHDHRFDSPRPLHPSIEQNDA